MRRARQPAEAVAEASGSVEGAGRGQGAADARRTGPGRPLHARPDHRAAAQRADPLADRTDRHAAAAGNARRARETPRAQPRPATGPADDPGRHERAPPPDDPHPRRDRQRQDRGLHPGHPGGDPFRPAGDRAGAGNQPDAADGRAVPPAVRRGGRAAQPPERRRAALALAADRRGGACRWWSAPAARSSPPRRTWG